MDDEIHTLLQIAPVAVTMGDLGEEGSAFTAVTPTCNDFLSGENVPSLHPLETAATSTPAWDLLASSPCRSSQQSYRMSSERLSEGLRSVAVTLQQRPNGSTATPRSSLTELVNYHSVGGSYSLGEGPQQLNSSSMEKKRVCTSVQAQSVEAGGRKKAAKKSNASTSAVERSKGGNLKAKGAKVSKSKTKSKSKASNAEKNTQSVLDQIRSQVLEKLPYKNRANKRYGIVSCRKPKSKEPQKDSQQQEKHLGTSLHTGSRTESACTSNASSNVSVKTGTCKALDALKSSTALKDAAAAAVAAAEAASKHASLHTHHQNYGTSMLGKTQASHSSMVYGHTVSQAPKSDRVPFCMVSTGEVQAEFNALEGRTKQAHKQIFEDKDNCKEASELDALQQAKAAAIYAFPYLKRPPTTCMDNNTRPDKINGFP